MKVLKKNKQKDESIIIEVPNDSNKQIPLWMTEQRAAYYYISDKPKISMKALFLLIELLDCCEEESSL